MTFDTKIDLIERQQLNRGHVHSVHFTGVVRDSPDVRNRRVFGDSNIFDQEDELGKLIEIYRILGPQIESTNLMYSLQNQNLHTSLYIIYILRLP